MRGKATKSQEKRGKARERIETQEKARKSKDPRAKYRFSGFHRGVESALIPSGRKSIQIHSENGRLEPLLEGLVMFLIFKPKNAKEPRKSDEKQGKVRKS